MSSEKRQALLNYTTLKTLPGELSCNVVIHIDDRNSNKK